MASIPMRRAQLELMLQCGKVIYPVLISLALTYVTSYLGCLCYTIGQKYHGEVPFCLSPVVHIALASLSFVNLMFVLCYATVKQYRLMKISERLFPRGKEFRSLSPTAAEETEKPIADMVDQQHQLA